MPEIRVVPAREADLSACRLLLGADLIAGTRPTFLVALREQELAGAAAYLTGTESIDGIRIRVVRPLRRKGIGTLLLERVEQVARERSLARMHSAVKDSRNPDAEAASAFLTARNFTVSYTLTDVEAEVASMATYYRSLCDRLRRSGRVPATASIVRMAEAPLDQVTRLYKERMVPERLAGRRLSFGLGHPKYHDCPVALDSGRVAGMLLWEIHGETGYIPARVVAPGWEGSWVNPLLLERATAQGFERNIQRIRFEIPLGNRDTGKLASRYRASVAGSAKQYVREFTPSEPEQ